MTRATALLAAMSLLIAPRRSPAQQSAHPVYLAFALSSGPDQVALLRFAPPVFSVVHRTVIGTPAAPLGLRTVLPVAGGAEYDLLTVRGFPNGELLRVAIARDSSRYDHQPSDTVKSAEPVGPLPDAIALSRDGKLAWVSNSGDTAAGGGTVSVVYLNAMVEAARIHTCAGAAGAVLIGTAPATFYSVCRGANQLVAIDGEHLAVTRRIALAEGAGDCGPSAVVPDRDSTHLFVACARSGEVLDVDLAAGTVARRIVTGGGPVALAMTHDGNTLLVADSVGQVVTLVDLAGGRVSARVVMPRRMPAASAAPVNQVEPIAGFLFAAATLPRAPLALAITPDDRYALIAVAGGPDQQGTIEVLDLGAVRLVAVMPLPAAVTGVAIWKVQ